MTTQAAKEKESMGGRGAGCSIVLRMNINGMQKVCDNLKFSGNLAKKVDTNDSVTVQRAQR